MTKEIRAEGESGAARAGGVEAVAPTVDTEQGGDKREQASPSSSAPLIEAEVKAEVGEVVAAEEQVADRGNLARGKYTVPAFQGLVS